MIRAYEYAFYSVYSWQTRMSRVAADTSAVLFLTIVIVWHALSAFAVAEGMARRPLLPGGLTKLQLLLFAAVVFTVQHLILVYSGRYKAISARYTGESLRQRRVRGAIVVSYAVISFILLICASMFRGGRLHV